MNAILPSPNLRFPRPQVLGGEMMRRPRVKNFAERPLPSSICEGCVYLGCKRHEQALTIDRYGPNLHHRPGYSLTNHVRPALGS